MLRKEVLHREKAKQDGTAPSRREGGRGERVLKRHKLEKQEELEKKRNGTRKRLGKTSELVATIIGDFSFKMGERDIGERKGQIGVR